MRNPTHLVYDRGENKMIDVNKFNVLYLDSDNAKVDIKSNHFYVLNGSLFIYQLTKSAKEFI